MAGNVLRRARWTAVILGTLLAITFIAMVYAFVQQAEAKLQATLVIECERQSAEIRQELEMMNLRVQQEADRAEAAMRLAEEMRVKAESESKK